MKATIQKINQHLLFTVEGLYDFKKFLSELTNLSNECKKSNFSKVLIYTIDIDWKSLTSMDRFFLGEKGAELFLGVRMAFVITKESYDGFAKLVAQNRGAIIESFFDLDDALDWLYKV